jgi:HAD superfamily hydrolase (TIGR01450 family)
LVRGAEELIGLLRKRGIRPLFFTNNSTKTREEIMGRLTGMGLDLSLSDVYTSAHATASYAELSGLRQVYCIGSTGLFEELSRVGIMAIEEVAKARALIVGLDLNFDYESPLSELKQFPISARFIACNMDMEYLGQGGRLMPGCGRVVEKVSTILGRKPDYIVGKPNTFMIERLAEDWNMERDNVLVVGDTYTSDIEMALRYGCQSVYIGSRKTEDDETVITVQDIREIQDMFED